MTENVRYENDPNQTTRDRKYMWDEKSTKWDKREIRFPEERLLNVKI